MTHKPPTIGLFISSSQNGYEATLYQGVSDVIRAAGAHLVCFTSGALRAYHGFEFQRNVLFDLVNADIVDGLIISGTLAHPVSMEEMEAFLHRYEHLPRVTIALETPEVPCVMVDSYSGIQAVVSHLVQTHGYTKIGFLRGPAGQQEAEERYQAYRDTMQANRLAVDPDWILQGDYTPRSGIAAAQALLACAHVRLEALVSANDTMAIGAAKVLRAAGIRIPEDLALTGFDDTAEARFDASPMTSVRQDIREQGAIAAQTLLDQIAGKPIAHRVVAPAALVVRRSCGCTGFAPPALHPALIGSDSWVQNLTVRKQEISAQVEHILAHIPRPKTSVWAKAWLDAITASLSSGNSDAFYDSLEQTLLDGADLGIEVAAWNTALDAFFYEVMMCLSNPPEKSLVRQMHERARLRVGEIAEEIESRRQIDVSWQMLAFRELGEMLSTTFEMAEALDVLSSELEPLRVKACYLSLFEDPQNPAGQARLIFAWAAGQRIPIAPEGVLYPSPQLLPAGMVGALASPGLVVEALYSKEDRLGFLVLETSPKDIDVCNALRGLLSGALQGVLLLEQRRKTESRLLKTQGQLTSLVSRLEAANRELESFSYTVSHDLRAPLRAIIGFSSILKQEYSPALDEEAHHLIDRIVKNGQRMATLIDELLAFSRAGRHEIRTQWVDMYQVVLDVHADLAEQFPQRQVEWSIHPLPPAFTDLVLVRQVWANLLNNAVKYTARRPDARVEVGSYEENGQVVYFVRDNGVGFDMQYAGKLFGVFQRLHADEEFAGTGIGLAISHRIITRQNGRIWADSKIDQGSVFCFTLPPGE